MEPEQFGKLLATRRKELGMTQARLGEKLHLTAKLFLNGNAVMDFLISLLLSLLLRL